MSFQITEAFVKDFRSGITLRSQQEFSRLRGCVRVEGGITGTEASFDHVSNRRPSKRTSRHGDTVLSDTPHDRRWVELNVYDDADMVDKPDLVRTLTDPTNVYSRSMAAGFGRLYDEVIMDAAISDSQKIGVDGASTVAFDADPAYSSILGFNGGAGVALALSHLQEVKEGFDSREQPTRRFWAVNARFIRSLMVLDEVENFDFNTMKVLAEGEMNSYMGFEWKRVEDPILKLSPGSTGRQTIAWAEDSLLLGLGMDVSASIDRRPDKNNSTQVFYSADFGGARMEDKSVMMFVHDPT